MKKHSLEGLKTLRYLIVFFVLGSCQEQGPELAKHMDLSFEKIEKYRYPMVPGAKPFQYRLTYFYGNGLPHRWMDLDSTGSVETDYIYEYDAAWKQTGARYREEGASAFSIEKVRFENDSTRTTEWIDSTGSVYYTMIDNLNEAGKTYRAAFIGDKLHGYDSTLYTEDGFEKRIFFTNTKGKVYNDRSFVYDSLNANGDWVIRKKIMQDTIREIHFREIHYGNDYLADDGKYLAGIVSTGKASENVLSFSQDQQTLFLTRTTGWEVQSGHIAYCKNGLFTETFPVDGLDSIYNGAISPNADKILYSVREGDRQSIWLLTKKDGQWGEKKNLSESSNVQGGYFYWLNKQEIYFYSDVGNGDILLGELSPKGLTVTDSLDALNTPTATEFSPYVDPDTRFIIFTRYLEGDPSNQGFFISYNQGDSQEPKWTQPKKIDRLPYGWSAQIINDGTLFLYSDGEDIRSISVDALGLKTMDINNPE